MALEIRLDDRNSKVELVRKDKNFVEILVDGRLYKLDIIMVEDGVYSILHDGKSFNLELIEGETRKKYIVNTLYKSFNIEIIDAETRYQISRNRNLLGDDQSIISSPMPGKVVKIPVKAGDKVEAGDTVIIVSAMKMESEYKTGKSGVIKEIHVSEGDTIEGHQALITIE
jgi:biotin carboxyl carrier protein